MMRCFEIWEWHYPLFVSTADEFVPFFKQQWPSEFPREIRQISEQKHNKTELVHLKGFY